MEKKRFRTLVKWEGRNDYIKGRISGMMFVICDGVDEDSKHYGMQRTELGSILTTKCTDEQYQEFIKFVEASYPGLCIFNYEG